MAIADANQVRDAYPPAALKAHPEIKPECVDIVQLITLAFKVLSCPVTCGRLHQQRCCFSNGVIALLVCDEARLDFPMKRKACADPNSELSVSKRWKQSAQHNKTTCQSPHRHGGLNSVPLAVSPVPCPSPATNCTLERLRVALQAMDAPSRRARIIRMTPHARDALLAFMERHQKPPTGYLAQSPQDSPNTQGYKVLRRHSPSSRLIGVRALKTMAGTRYKTHLGIKGFRLYTRAVEDIEIAIRYNAILRQVRNALSDASVSDPFLWNSPDEALKLCQLIFHENGTSESDMGLNAFMYMRGAPWLNRDCFIISHSMSLEKALMLHTRFLHAIRTSWDCLKLEWVLLLRCKGYSSADAERIADKARNSAVDEQINNALRGLEQALKRDARVVVRAKKALVVERRKAARVDETHAISKLKTLRSPRLVRQERWKWSRRSKLTNAHIIRGPPPHLGVL